MSAETGTFLDPSISETVLKEEKCTLLSEIKGFLDTSFFEETSAGLIREKVERYNTIRDHEDSLKPYIRRDPLDVLPLEVWEEIIHECTPTPTDTKCPIQWSIDELLKLTSVSKRWRAIILQTPSFWRNISVSERTEDLEAKVALCLSLSRDYLLNINVEIPTQRWEAVGPMIGPQSFRIRSLALSSQYHDAFHNCTIRYVLAYFTELTSLQEFVFPYRSSVDVDSILQSANSILKIHNIGAFPEILGRKSLAGLRYLYTDLPFMEVFPYFPTLKHLKEVSFYGFGPTLNTKRKAALIPEQPLNWTSLTYKQSHAPYFDGLISQLASTLQHLSVVLYWEKLNELLDVCTEMHKLHSLEMEIFYSSPPVAEVSITYPSSIRSLSLTLHYVEGERRVYGTNLDRLFKTLITLAPAVELLRINTSDVPECAFSYIKSLQQLKTLNYTYTEGESFYSELVTLPTVEEVTFNVSCSSWFPRICCPSALYLSYFATSSIPWHLEDGLWSNLQSLCILTSAVTWTDISLPHVKRITLGSYLVSWPGDPCTNLFKELARRPTTFPSLEALQTRYFPEWDILFIMLERHNFLIDSTVSQIHTIGFPVLPPPKILQEISYRLGGRLSERPSNYELSVYSHLKTYFDPTVRGCVMCHRGLLYCSIYSPRTRSGSVQEHKAPPYPLTADEVISSHRDRTDWFIKVGAMFRPSHCPRYHKNKYQEITGFVQPGLLGSPN